MKIIVSFDSLFGNVSEEYIKALQSQNSGFIDVFDIITETYSKDYSNIDIYIDSVYFSILECIQEIQKSRKPIILVKNSLAYIDSKIIDFLIAKGLSYEESVKKVNDTKNKYNIKEYSDISVFFTNFVDHKNVVLENPSNILKYYQSALKSNSIIKVDINSPKTEIITSLSQLIQSALEKQLPKIKGERYILGIGGLSETGKSNTGRILMEKFNIPNFKFNYINDVVMQTYGIEKNENLFSNESEFIAIFVINEIINLLNRMYYWNMVSFESLHDYALTKKMKELLPDNFIILFLQANKNIRIERNAIEFNDDLGLSEKEIDKKDKIKTSRGAAKIFEISNYIVNNDGKVEDLEKKLYNILDELNRRKQKMRNRAGGLLIENGKVLLMHRIKNVNGVINEYYVVPGGGMEEGETLEEATKRELNEEIGIEVELIEDEPFFTLEQEQGNQYFSLINKISGEIGTGNGPEFNDPNYANRGLYAAEMISIKDIVEGKVNMVPQEIKEKFIEAILSLNIDFEYINSLDLLGNTNKRTL